MGLVDLFFPPACVACGKVMESGAAFFCSECERGVEPLPPGACRGCADPGPFAAKRCARCTTHPPPFSRGYAPYLHEGPVARAIHQFKYEDHPELAVPLAQLLARSASAFLVDAPLEICAVPLHRRRFVERKYDQAELLGRALAKATSRKYATGALERIRETKRQVGLSEADRASNVAGAFDAQQVEGKRLLLVDDVLTTGATAKAAAQALKDAGAREVQVLAIARALRLDR